MKVAILWIIDENGKILLARRSENMDSDPGVWGPSVSGRIEENESPKDAVVRETREELGLDIEPVFLHNASYEFHQDGKSREYSIYYLKVKNNIIKSFVLAPEEVAEVKWISLEELQDLVVKKSETLIISSATDLWNRIFLYLKPLAIKDSYE